MQRPPTIAGLLAVIFAAGIRPCSGAVIILAFALSHDMFLVGVQAVLAMAAGTACTTLACATTAAFAKRLARRLVNRPAGNAASVMAALETGVGAAVFWLGIVLISGRRPL